MTDELNGNKRICGNCGESTWTISGTLPFSHRNGWCNE